MPTEEQLADALQRLARIQSCHCCACLDASRTPAWPGSRPSRQYMVLCPKCGNKRCPHASWHGFDCSGSNKSGQIEAIEAEQLAECGHALSNAEAVADAALAERDAMKAKLEHYRGILALEQIDPAPPDVDWLKSVGFEPPYEGSAALAVGVNYRLIHTPDKRWRVAMREAESCEIPTPATRADVLTLMRLLGCGKGAE